MAITGVFGSQKEAKVVALIDRICATLNIKKDGSSLSNKEMSNRADAWANAGEDILTSGGDETMDPSFFEEVDEYFKVYEQKESKLQNKKEFEKIESFIKDEKVSGRKRRDTARLLAASEEVRVSAEVAELKTYRFAQGSSAGLVRLREKIADVENSHASRKMVISRASRMATADCRRQFKRVREFFQSLHDNRKDKLKYQYERSLKIQSMLHRLRKSDPRVMALEQNTAERIYRKKEADMTELNMVQNLEEATYLEKIIVLLDDVLEAKEAAADAYFQLQIKNLKSQQHDQAGREKEIMEMRTKSMLEMAELIAKYVKEEMADQEDDEETKELVERTERKKDFEGSHSKVLLSVSDLYDTILWSVANGSIGISSSDSDSFDSYEDDDEEEAIKNNNNNNADNENLDDDLIGVEPTAGPVNSNGVPIIENNWKDTGDTASVQSGSTANTTDVNTSENLSPVGHIFVKRLRKEIRAKEKKLEKRHLAEHKATRKQFRSETRKLKERHQTIVDVLLARCVEERQKLRDAISRRMTLMEQKQSFSTNTLQEGIEADVKAMQGAWVEHKRLEEEQKTTFAKAQALISAQVFHEVRNALSSVVAMSEMTSSLQKDPSVTSETLVSSVSEMLDQNKEVVNYSLNMLNNILDVSKIKAGSFETKETFFDLQDLVNRATTMQLVKAKTRGVKMSFAALPEPQVAYSDEDIVARIITNFISNAVKFTKAGAVQPFVCPLEDIDPSNNTKPKFVRVDGKNKKASSPNNSGKKNSPKDGNNEEAMDEDDATFAAVKYVAVGVADTGPGLSRELLSIAEDGLFNSDASKMNSGAKNSGFGLHLAHQLASTLGSEVNLTDLETFQKYCNVDMASVLNTDLSSIHDSASDAGSVYSEDTPGKGTVLYITIPVISDSRKGVSMLNTKPGSQLALDESSKKYVFSPQPAPNSVDGCFRILVADDVAMLRKGLMRSVLDIFKQISNCRISVSTACTAEDALRAIESNSYDMFICDNQFAPPTHLNRFPPEYENTRLHVDSFGNMVDTRNKVAQFFKNEAFTIAPGDGSLSGLDALLQLAQTTITTNPSISVPILVLHSGHELELPRNLGIIVVRKPLKRNDFVPLFERNAQNLIETGMCVEVKRNDCTVVLNRGGAQLFVRRKGVEANSRDSGDNATAMDLNMDGAQLVRKRNSDDAQKGASALIPNEGADSPQHKKLKSNKPNQVQLDHG
jgi:signal transduction histidine kinase